MRVLTLVMGLFLSLGAFAQITVQGLVKDATGEGVIGASIRVVEAIDSNTLLVEEINNYIV